MPLKLREPPPCDGCRGNCCESLRPHLPSDFQQWRDAGIELLPVALGFYRCPAHDQRTGRCTIWARRPRVCRAYSCLDETGEWILAAPSCALPRSVV